jgi:hypothetical protein
MDTSQIEILPLPKSRPGWLAAIFLALLGMIIYSTARPTAHAYLLDTYYETVKQQYHFDSADLQVSITTPRFVDSAKPYPVDVDVVNMSSFPETNLNSIQVSQRIWDAKPDQYSNVRLDTSLYTNEHFQNTFLFTAPKDAKNGTPLGIGGLFYLSQGTAGFESAPIKVDRWRALQVGALKSLTETNSGMTLVVVFALISVWLVEDERHQVIWLSTKKGWGIFKDIFFKSLRIFSPMLLAIGIVVASPKYLSISLVILLILAFFGFLFESNITKIIENIAAKSRKDRNSKKNTDADSGKKARLSLVNKNQRKKTGVKSPKSSR